jgi:hypothetical protein
MIFAAAICQILFPGYLSLPTSLPEVTANLQQPFTAVSLLSAYGAALLVAWRYLRHIHYPFWRMMDSNVIGVTLVGLGWLVGTLIRQPNIVLGAITVALALIFLALLAIYQKIERPGLVSSGHVIAVFTLCLTVQYLLVPWQGTSSVVEYAAGSIGVMAAVAALSVRLRQRTTQASLVQIPNGVSQKFRETFSLLLSRQPSTKDGSTHKKTKKETAI